MGNIADLIKETEENMTVNFGKLGIALEIIRNEWCKNVDCKKCMMRLGKLCFPIKIGQAVEIVQKGMRLGGDIKEINELVHDSMQESEDIVGKRVDSYFKSKMEE